MMEEINDTNKLNLSENKRKLIFYWPPVIIVGIGSLLILISMFLPYLSSSDVDRISNNMMIQKHPAFLLGTIIGIISIFRYWSVGSKSSANISIWAGIWLLGCSIYDAYYAQLVYTGTTVKIETSAAAGLWLAGVGSTIIALGGLMMRFPHSSFLIEQTITKEEKIYLESLTKICPKCAETIKSAALVCRFCGHQFKIDNEKKETEINNT